MTQQEKEIKIADYFFLITEEKSVFGEAIRKLWNIPEEGPYIKDLAKYKKVARNLPTFLKFTTSLDWIEPVLEKMLKEGAATCISSHAEHDHECFIQIKNSIKRFEVGGDTRLEAIVDAVIQYIDYKLKQS